MKGVTHQLQAKLHRALTCRGEQQDEAIVIVSCLSQIYINVNLKIVSNRAIGKIPLEYAVFNTVL